MKRKDLLQWTAAVVLVLAAVVILKYGPSVPKAEAAEGAASMTAGGECTR